MFLVAVIVVSFQAVVDLVDESPLECNSIDIRSCCSCREAVTIDVAAVGSQWSSLGLIYRALSYPIEAHPSPMKTYLAIAEP
jgi:hypothetical protein